MIRHGDPPYLECSSVGDKRFSAFHARLIRYNFASIEELYQRAKRFDPVVPDVIDNGRGLKQWEKRKGKMPNNYAEVSLLYQRLWDEYLEENLHLLPILCRASGLSDRYGQMNHNCQATVLWNIRQRILGQPITRSIT